MTNEERMQQQIDELKTDFAEVLEYVAAIHTYLGGEHAKHVSLSRTSSRQSSPSRCSVNLRMLKSIFAINRLRAIVRSKCAPNRHSKRLF